MLYQAFNALLDYMEYTEAETDNETIGNETIGNETIGNEKKPMSILMKPDHHNSLFWNDDGKCVGGCDRYDVAGLDEWFNQWEDEISHRSNHWSNAEWKDWWTDGLQLARSLRKQMPANVELYYFSLNDSVWAIRPSETIGEGLFDMGEPIRID